MNLYESGGHHDDPGFYPIAEQQRMKASVKFARDFIWSHWQQKKRGYLVIFKSSVDAGSDYYIFIEPDQRGDWQIVRYSEPWGMFVCPGTIDKLPPIKSVKVRKATEDDWPAQLGTYCLRMIDADGDDFSL